MKEVGGKRTLSITGNIAKKTQILHMGLSTCVKHCPIFFLLVFDLLLRNNVCNKTELFLLASLGVYLFNENKETFCRS